MLFRSDLDKLTANTTRREQIFKEIHDSMAEFSKLEVDDYNNENEHLQDSPFLSFSTFFHNFMRNGPIEMVQNCLRKNLVTFTSVRS